MDYLLQQIETKLTAMSGEAFQELMDALLSEALAGYNYLLMLRKVFEIG
jgi:hypothetical protein